MASRLLLIGDDSQVSEHYSIETDSGIDTRIVDGQDELEVDTDQ